MIISLGRKQLKDFFIFLDQFTPTVCINEALKLCIKCNNSVFNNKHFLQSDSTAQGPHTSCSYSHVAIQYFDVKALEYNPAATRWRRFIRDDIFIIRLHSIYELNICSRLHEQSWPYETNSIYCGSCYCCIRFLDLDRNFDQESKKIL